MSSRVHGTVSYRGGYTTTLCGRRSPKHSTASYGWVTCRMCLRKLQELQDDV